MAGASHYWKGVDIKRFALKLHKFLIKTVSLKLCCVAENLKYYSFHKRKVLQTQTMLHLDQSGKSRLKLWLQFEYLRYRCLHISFHHNKNTLEIVLWELSYFNPIAISTGFHLMLFIYLSYNLEFQANELFKLRINKDRLESKSIFHLIPNISIPDLCYSHVNLDGEKQQSQKKQKSVNIKYISF